MRAEKKCRPFFRDLLGNIVISKRGSQGADLRRQSLKAVIRDSNLQLTLFYQIIGLQFFSIITRVSPGRKGMFLLK